MIHSTGAESGTMQIWRSVWIIFSMKAHLFPTFMDSSIAMEILVQHSTSHGANRMSSAMSTCAPGFPDTATMRTRLKWSIAVVRLTKNGITPRIGSWRTNKQKNACPLQMFHWTKPIVWTSSPLNAITWLAIKYGTLNWISICKVKKITHA